VTYTTFLKGYDAGFPKKSKLSINSCFGIFDCSKNGISAYLAPEKCQYLRSGLTDFGSKTGFWKSQ
jgi:hypothetical protein